MSWPLQVMMDGHTGISPPPEYPTRINLNPYFVLRPTARVSFAGLLRCQRRSLTRRLGDFRIQNLTPLERVLRMSRGEGYASIHPTLIIVTRN